MKTIEAIDFRGEPFVNITFTAPRPIDDIWEFAATLTGDEWSYDDLQTPWTTTITGATTYEMSWLRAAKVLAYSCK